MDGHIDKRLLNDTTKIALNGLEGGSSNEIDHEIDCLLDCLDWWSIPQNPSENESEPLKVTKGSRLAKLRARL